MIDPETLKRINATRKTRSIWPLATIVWFVLFFVSIKIHPGAAVVWLLLFPFFAYLIQRYDRKRRVTVIAYPDVLRNDPRFVEMSEAFKKVSRSIHVWQVLSEQQVRALQDRKRSAGAGALISRKKIRAILSSPHYLQLNLSAPTFMGSHPVYFLPDGMLIDVGKEYRMVPYSELEFQASATRFIESAGRPRDAKQVDETWQYVNKGGGPDKRMKNNRKLPVMLYDVLRIRQGTWLELEFQASASGVFGPLVLALSALRIGASSDNVGMALPSASGMDSGSDS